MEDRQEIKDKIQRRRLQMLVHSHIYYQLNDSIVSDHDFDTWAKELVELQEKYPEEASEVVYHRDFIGFDGSSGYDLPYNDPYIHSKAVQLLRYRRELNETNIHKG